MRASRRPSVDVEFWAVPFVKRFVSVGLWGRNESRTTPALRRGMGDSVAARRQRSPSIMGCSSSSSSDESSSESAAVPLVWGLVVGFGAEAAVLSNTQLSTHPDKSPTARILLLSENTTHLIVRSNAPRVPWDAFSCRECRVARLSLVN